MELMFHEINVIIRKMYLNGNLFKASDVSFLTNITYYSSYES